MIIKMYRWEKSDGVLQRASDLSSRHILL